ncbi:hypothetical protein AN218_18785, partial [Streptomyces nanshensis]
MYGPEEGQGRRVPEEPKREPEPGAEIPADADPDLAPDPDPDADPDPDPESAPRVLLVTGAGGAGRTTVAAAT